MVTETPIKAEARNLDFYYNTGHKALKGISMPLYEKKITALIGPSGCGKSTFLRCFNRMHDLYPGNKYDGEIVMHPDNTNILAAGVDPIEVRMRISMVFQKPNPFPKSIYENVAYGLRVRGESDKRVVDEKVEEALKGAALWNEVKDRLNDLAFNLSGGHERVGNDFRIEATLVRQVGLLQVRNLRADDHLLANSKRGHKGDRAARI